MKNILITGKNSYIANHLAEWLSKQTNKFAITKISLRDDQWKKQTFSKFEVVVHAAGIAHRKETKDNAYLYYKVNRDLTFELAKKAKKEGVNHFIFISSMSVYGMETGVIDENTIPIPTSNYGKSKLQAEELIMSLEDETFKIAIIRPPMVYGKGCKGNYVRLSKLALKTPIFPDFKNKRSMIYIDNLCEFIRIAIVENYTGIFHPQNKEYVCTRDLVKLIATIHGKRVYFTKILNFLITSSNFRIFKKMFGDLIYSYSLSDVNNNSYIVKEFEESILTTQDVKVKSI